MHQPTPVRKQARKTRDANLSVLRWLIFCFPAGLLMMWSNGCSWHRAIKSAVSLAFVAIVLALVLPQTRAPQPQLGGIQVVSLASAAEQVGPTMKAGATPYEAYVPKYSAKDSVLVEPTPTPFPVTVYCNDGGEFYHTKKCKYTKDTTPPATLLQAVNAGFKACKKCKPPTVTEVYGYGFVG